MHTSYFRTGMVSMTKATFGILLIEMIARHVNGINDAPNMQIIFAHLLIMFYTKYSIDVEVLARDKKEKKVFRTWKEGGSMNKKARCGHRI